jgi:protein SCO1/2
MKLVNILPAFIITTAAILNQANADTGQQTSGTSKTYTRAEEFYSIPDLKILRQDGVTTTFPEELDDGRPVILNFIFTSCAAICPVSSRVLSNVQNKFGNEIQDVHMVSVSIDPEYDNAARINKYAEKFKAKPQWQFYTGTADNIKALQMAFKVFRGDKMNHTATTFLRSSPGKPWIRLDGFASADDIVVELGRTLGHFITP